MLKREKDVEENVSRKECKKTFMRVRTSDAWNVMWKCEARRQWKRKKEINYGGILKPCVEK